MMLSSSDAKWRCMWHMLVWSILITMVSQYLNMQHHITLYIFAALGILVLPVFTAVYSNTSGRHGSNLIRVAYVVCDPVLACIAISPVLLLNHLPDNVNQFNCLIKYEDLNLSRECMYNRSSHSGSYEVVVLHPSSDNMDKEEMLNKVMSRFLAIQISVAMPILLSLLMGRRSRKMRVNTFILTFAYWFVTAIELVDMMETSRMGDIYKDVIFTTEAIISITMIITNSYAIVTLCSFISPHTGQKGEKQFCKNFNLIYRVFVGASGVLFTEIPLLVARFQMLIADTTRLLPATFYLWCIKDFLFICLILFILMAQKFGKKSVITKLPYTMKFDNIDVVFQPEKRDEYIVSKKRVRFQDPPATTFGENCKEMRSLSDIVDVQNENKDVKRIPSSVLKVSGSQSCPNSPVLRSGTVSGKLTDLSMRKPSPSSSVGDVSTKILNSSDSSSGVFSYSPSDNPSLSSSQSLSPRITGTGGARPKVHTPLSKHNNPKPINTVREIKSRPDVDSDENNVDLL